MIQKWDGKGTVGLAVMSRQAVRDFDKWAIGQMRIPGAVLMENAGRGAAQCLLEQFSAVSDPRVTLFCGSGNNGGDGYVIARHLVNQGVSPQVVLCGDRDHIRGEARTHLEIIEAMDLPIRMLDWDGNLLEQVRRMTEGAHWVVDALLGTGLQGELKEPMVELLCSINAAGVPIFAVDIPSGLDCDTGLPLPISIRADCTVTFAALKKGFTDNPECRQVTGPIYVASIGISPPPGA